MRGFAATPSFQLLGRLFLQPAASWPLLKTTIAFREGHPLTAFVPTASTWGNRLRIGSGGRIAEPLKRVRYARLFHPQLTPDAKPCPPPRSHGQKRPSRDHRRNRAGRVVYRPATHGSSFQASCSRRSSPVAMSRAISPSPPIAASFCRVRSPGANKNPAQ